MYNLKVIIIGAGIGGLTTGIALRQAGYKVEIYDKAKELRPAGAGISLWSNGVKVLNRLGLGENIAQIGGQMDRMEYRSHTDELLNDIDLMPLVEKVGQRPYPVARTDLQDLLLEAFGREDVQLNSRCIAVEESDHHATAIFEGDRKVTGDIVIGADGIHSVVRRYVTEKEISLRYANYVNWNGLVKADKNFTSKNNWVIYVGEGKRASMMPVGGDRFYFFFGCPMVKGSTVEPEKRREELAKLFQGWATPVQKLIQNLDPLQTNRLEIHDIDPLDRLVRGKIVLLGDSAHATTPTLGQGGCQAMEDAEILSRYLLTTTLSVEDALKRYENARKERTANLVLKARKRTDTIYSKEGDRTQKWYDQLKQENPEDVIEALAKIILSGPLN
ncbi:FAD-dependent urate hydroxylase HpxO [Spirulina sp. 06S082]|uniref:FAD-dependent urate hydroxylase HpxO n=1 Tax=Spirulina sp. 06S082 TaxID=3110248 RepID=UPI002B1F28D4|nr:FAD-dependent urate hydroxylase HpxO [Spirulina sp. 06S082]MEA5470699.1 FAD-dependent urate hydroxylase HpxO [Spirulina sp. 06S082]